MVSLTEDSFVVSLPPPLELPVSGRDFTVVVVVSGMSRDPKVDEGLVLTDGEKVFLPTSISRSKTSPMTAPRCGF